MTDLITSDWHLSDNPRDAYRHLWQAQLLALVKSHKIERLFVLGDLTEEKDRHGSWLTNKIVGYLYELGQQCEVIILRGNHDARDPSSPFFAFTRMLENVRWINEPTILDEQTLLLPHTSNYERDWRSFKLGDYPLIMAHGTFAGAKTETGFQLDGIPISIFQQGQESPLVISGDIHTPQTIEGVVTYVGAPYTVDFGDDYKPRVLLLTNGQLTSIGCTGPQKRLVGMSARNLAISKVKRGDILKVRVAITDAERADWPRIRQEVQQAADKLGCIVYAIQPVIETTGHIAHSVKRTSGRRSDRELYDAYTKALNLDASTIKAGLFLMQKAEK